MTKILAWHFVRDDGARNQDGVIEVVGKTYKASGALEMCVNGMHASERVIDALQYAQGSRVRLVECWGSVERDSDKLVCRYRRVLWELDATMLLHRFAIGEARRALRRAKVKDPRCWEALAVKQRWIAGKATDVEMAAVSSAVRVVAWDATRVFDLFAFLRRGHRVVVAWDATRAAVMRVAAWEAARDSAAWSAVRVAAWSSRWAAAMATAMAAANKRLTKLIESAHVREVAA